MTLESFIWLIDRHIATVARTVGTALFLLILPAMADVAAADISLELTLGRERAYTDETVPVTVTLRISNSTVRNISYPRLASPGGGAIAFSPPVQDTDAVNPDVTLQRFTGQIRGIKPGLLTVGPASLDCEVMESAGGGTAFFAAVEPRPLPLVTAPTALTILPLPAAGRPVSFSGAVGNFNTSVSTKPEQISVGEPLTIITTIRGSGNLTNVICPQIKGPNLHSYPSRASHTADALVCEQVVVPDAPGAMPPVTWSYFDPQLHQYLSLRKKLPTVGTAARLVAVAPASVASASSPPSAAPFTTRKIHPLVLPVTTIILLVSVTILTVRILRRPRLIDFSPEPPVSTALQLTELIAVTEQALDEGDVDRFYTFTMLIFQQIIGAENGLPPQGIISLPESFFKNNRKEYVKLAQIFQRCHQVRYGRHEPHPEVLKHDILLIKTFLCQHRAT